MANPILPKHNNTSGVIPAAAVLQTNELAINTADAVAFVKHSDGTVKQIVDPSKAPLNSPAFTGIPTSPTATAGTNNTQIASTAFVAAAVSSASVPLSSSLPVANGTAAAGTGTTAARADHVHPTDTSLVSLSGNQTIAGVKTFSSSPIIPAGAGAGQAFRWDEYQKYCVKMGNGINQTNNQVFIGWSSINRLKVTVDYTDLGNIVFDTNFNASLAINGYQQLPSGLIIQWGSGTFAAGATVTFPIAFTNACTHVNWTYEIMGIGNIPRVSARSKTGFTMFTDVCCMNDQNTQPKSWFAIGY